MSNDHHIDIVEGIREGNNKLWMDILRIAYGHAPEETKKILRKININDQEISKWLRRLAD